jgi:hypothetical protein
VTLLRCIDGSRMGTERPLWTFVFIYKNLLGNLDPPLQIFFSYCTVNKCNLG